MKRAGNSEIAVTSLRMQDASRFHPEIGAYVDVVPGFKLKFLKPKPIIMLYINMI